MDRESLPATVNKPDGEGRMNRYKSYAMAYTSLFLGFCSLSLLTAFLFLGSFSVIDLGLDESRALFLDACLSLLFFVQHSVMVRQGFRKRFAGMIPDEYYSAFYSIVSGITLLSVMVIWQKTPGLAASAEGIHRILLRTLFFLTIAGFTWGTLSLGSFDPYGVKKILRHIHHKETRPMPMIVRGAYRWVRHPLYFFSLVMIWSCPDLTSDRLLFNLMWSVWIVIATMLEERDLVLEFGEPYREYRTRVPMIIPYKIP
jgi:methanethiol S-methyltransferase